MTAVLLFERPPGSDVAFDETSFSPSLSSPSSTCDLDLCLQQHFRCAYTTTCNHAQSIHDLFLRLSQSSFSPKRSINTCQCGSLNHRSQLWPVLESRDKRFMIPWKWCVLRRKYSFSSVIILSFDSSSLNWCIGLEDWPQAHSMHHYLACLAPILFTTNGIKHFHPD